MKAVKAIAAILVAVIGLLISSCGLLLLGFSFGGEGMGSSLPIAVPLVIVGGVLIWGGVALGRSLSKSAKGATAAPHPDDIPPAT